MKQATHFSVQRGWKLLISDMGIDPADVLKLAGLPADLFSRKDASLSPGDYFRLWHGLEMLPSGQSSIEETARRLAMSKRSLQRV